MREQITNFFEFLYRILVSLFFGIIQNHYEYYCKTKCDSQMRRDKISTGFSVN